MDLRSGSTLPCASFDNVGCAVESDLSRHGGYAIPRTRRACERRPIWISSACESVAVAPVVGVVLEPVPVEDLSNALAAAAPVITRPPMAAEAPDPLDVRRNAANAGVEAVVAITEKIPATEWVELDALTSKVIDC